MRWLLRKLNEWLDREDSWMENLKHYKYQEGCRGWEDAPQTKWDEGVRRGRDHENL